MVNRDRLRAGDVFRFRRIFGLPDWTVTVVDPGYNEYYVSGLVDWSSGGPRYGLFFPDEIEDPVRPDDPTYTFE